AQKKQQSLYDGKVLLEKHDPPIVHDSKETLQLAQESCEKMKQMNKEIKPANYTKINHLSGEAAKFVGDFKSLANEADASLAKHKALELEIERLLKAVASQDIMIIASDHKDNTQDTSKNTKFAKQPIGETFPKVGKTNALSKPVTSNSVSTPQVSKGVNNAKAIAPGMFRISPDKISKEAKKVPNIVNASSRTKRITVLQPTVINKKNVNSDLNGLSSTGLDNTKTRKPQPRSNTKNDRVPSASKSSQSKNKEAKDVISKVVCDVCKKCLNSVNHDVCLNNYVNGKKSRGRKHKANVSKNETQQKNQPEIKKRKKSVCPRCKISDSSESKSQSDCSDGDNACCSKHMTGNLKLLINFVWKFMGTVRFGNDHVAAILGFVMNGNPSRVNIKELCGRIRRWRYNLISAESKLKNPMLDHQDKYMMKAQICPRLPNQKFVDPPSEDELILFIKDLGYSGRCEMLDFPEMYLLIMAANVDYVALLLLGSLKFVSKTEDYQKYGALIPDGMINQDIKDSKAFKTCYDVSTGKATLKKARKFKKVVSPSNKLPHVLEEGPTKKSKRVKIPAKKSTSMPNVGVVIRDTLGMFVSKKKPPAKDDIGKRIELLSNAALLEAAQLKKVFKKSRQETRTGVKPRVPDVSKVSSSESESDNESWGDSEDDEEDDDNNEDDGANDNDDSDVTHDSARTDSDDVKNPSFTLKDDEEEEYDKEYVHTPENDESDDDDED
nr:ribonuclease H-like domain-containing protein [Tanacetum cinerariifolium]